MKHIRWTEPWYGPNELEVHVTLECSKEHAINHSKNIAKQLGHEYPSDEEAYKDFITVHWAEEFDK
jgi:hypothetical protein